ncbi:AtzE family amidohydrolase [Calidifontimicrobium sp. SYSU G02091]|uniref:AtzE family amidohydrolase n=1 Tax=Calidifontimicrobium sp. SYSU G02091 TaxID=2926421 RepID=UPI001F53CF13|nr:AtzE family amidohydrolase [Calidifontimicrobium sp. SYSU G02091]MCI1193258.1 AtzE family amidohydrolase [Calidifontimicrobium sp. SYSU G02091]
MNAVDHVRAALARIEATDGRVHAFSAVLAERALARAAAVDASDAALPLRGVPFAVKNLFDLEGLTTLAGSKIERDAPPARRDATLVRRLEAAGAVCVGALHMDEYAYGFTTENSHYGPTRNPHDLARISGGSSGGSAAAVAAGQVPLALGSDTNGSIRVPASLCGVFGLKPTFGRLPRTGSYPFVASLDHLGPFARSTAELAAAYDAMQGHDPGDPAQAPRPVEATAPLLARGAEGLRIGVLGGWFRTMAQAPALAAVERAAVALGTAREVQWPEVDRARAAAFLITNAEGAALHLDDLRRRADDFDPLTRDRFLAGALLPAAWVQQAQRLRHWFARQVAASFETVDVVLAPATPCTAPVIGTEWLEIAGQRLPARASMGLLTQPVSCIGLPVVVVPLWGLDAAAPHLPIGVQVIAAPWREDLALRVAHALEAAGVASAPVAQVAEEA